MRSIAITFASSLRLVIITPRRRGTGRMLKQRDDDAGVGVSTERDARGRLELELAAATSRSLGALALSVACVMVGMGLLVLLGGAAFESTAPQAGTPALLIGAVLSLSLGLAARSGLVPPARLLDLGA